MGTTRYVEEGGFKDQAAVKVPGSSASLPDGGDLLSRDVDWLYVACWIFLIGLFFYGIYDVLYGGSGIGADVDAAKAKKGKADDGSPPKIFPRMYGHTVTLKKALGETAQDESETRRSARLRKKRTTAAN